jgi:TolB-like protein
VLAITALTPVVVYFRSARAGSGAISSNDTSIVVLPFADISPAKDQEYFQMDSLSN